MDDVERHERTVNSSELAGHARALQRSKHHPSVSTLFGEKRVFHVFPPEQVVGLPAKGMSISWRENEASQIKRRRGEGGDRGKR